MFRLENRFWETLERKYRYKPIQSTAGKGLQFSANNLTESISQYISNELQKLDDELYKVFIYRNKNTGYKKDNLYRLFKSNNPEWSPSRDLIDLLCYYSHSKSYENCVKEGLMKNNLEQFYLLKTERTLIGTDHQTLSDKIENKVLNYHKKKIELAIDYSEDIDLSLVSFDNADLDILEQLQPLKESLGEIHWELIKERLMVNPNLVKGLKITTPIDKTIVGFFIVYPISKKCRELIDKGAITKSDEFQLTHVCKDFKTADAVYISLVFSIDRYSRAFLMLKLKDELFTLVSKYPNIKILYVRPVSQDGFRITARSMFLKLPNSPTLYYQQPEFLKNGYKDRFSTE